MGCNCGGANLAYELRVTETGDTQKYPSWAEAQAAGNSTGKLYTIRTVSA